MDIDEDTMEIVQFLQNKMSGKRREAYNDDDDVGIREHSEMGCAHQ